MDMAASSQEIFSDVYSQMKSFVFDQKFHLSLILRVQSAITPHWFRQWPGAECATSPYLNRCWPYSLTRVCIRGNELIFSRMMLAYSSMNRKILNTVHCSFLIYIYFHLQHTFSLLKHRSYLGQLQLNKHRIFPLFWYATRLFPLTYSVYCLDNTCRWQDMGALFTAMALFVKIPLT